VVVGMNALGRLLVEAFAGRGERVVAVDTDAAKLAGLPAHPVVGSSNLRSVLEEAGVERARLVVSALQIEDANSLLAYRCREVSVPVAIHAFEPFLEEELLELDVEHLMIPKREGARQMVEELRRLGVLG
jgi:Trk K+ transport system NAD-binding subunit